MSDDMRPSALEVERLIDEARQEDRDEIEQLEGLIRLNHDIRTELKAEISRLQKLCCMCEGDCCRHAQERLAEIERLREQYAVDLALAFGRADAAEVKLAAIAVDAEARQEALRAAVIRADDAEAQVEILRNEAEENKLEWYAAVKATRNECDRAEAAEKALVDLNVAYAVLLESKQDAEASLAFANEKLTLCFGDLHDMEARTAKLVEALEWIATEYADDGSGITASKALAAAKASEEKP